MSDGAVVLAFVAALEADSALTTALGGEHVYRGASTRVERIPSVEWRKVTDNVRESTEPMLYQFDVWAPSYAVAKAIEQRLRRVLLPFPQMSGRIVLSGLPMLAEYDDGRDHEDPEPGVVHTSLDIRFEPAKLVV